ncbi:TonB-dependent receptor domain-containing protein [Hyunsoonleella pacifica]|uniref:TonB-dependent receptor n=1 Tax=Hyunsoonleella pacifica TaxID=1080224 RepID=A0A4Q9FTD2_9FLAO|nr:outer membrane beta-barrel family protein [Hyunsoonleella pacifica]TBN18619.1 TonB-dependent receptor [Hyunsoonleella pacifica]GGD03246.1 TonB-dependent receptor [Hyunsoonleella pacifica]
MKRITLILILVLPLLTFSQISITGKIIDDLGAVAGANVVLKNSQSKVIGTISDFDGNFILEVDKDLYDLTVSYVGYISYTKEINATENIDLGIVNLKEDTNTLDEVVITGKKRLVEQKADRIVFNVENSIVARNGDAIEALKITPGLQVRNEGVSIFGKGNTQIMINGRLIPITGEELTNYLNSIAGEDIKKIEVITAPPAKYDAAGDGGLINIILKTGTQNSWKNTVSVIHNIDTYNFTTIRNSFSFRKDKLNLSASLDKTRGNIRGIEDFQVFYPNSTWDIAIDTKDSKTAFSGRLLLDYNITDNTTIGVQYFGNETQPGITDRSITRIVNPANTIDSLLVNNGNEDQTRLSHSLNLHAITKLDTLGRTLSLDADYFTYEADRNRIFRTESFDVNNNFQNINLSAITTSLQSIKNKSLKLDMEHPFKHINVSYGARISSINSESGIAFFNTESGTPVLDTNISNTFKYKENNQAVYVSANKTIGKKWQLQMGLRYESTQTEGFSEDLNQTNKNNYSKVFPTVYALYKKDENNTFSFSYSKRIERPSFNNLNPFRVFVSSNTFSEGNPFLQPSFTDNFELKHTHKRNFTTNIFFNIKTDLSSVIFTSDIDTNTQIVTRNNFLNQYVFGLGESYTFNKLKWLESQNNFTLIHIKSKFTKPFNAPLQNGFAYIASSNNNIKLNNNQNIQVNANYESNVQYGLFSVGSTFSLDLGYSTTFFNKNLQFSALIKDVFNTSALNNLESTINNVRQVYGQNRNNRYLRFSLRYSFGNKKISTKNRRFGNEEETNRVN